MVMATSSLVRHASVPLAALSSSPVNSGVPLGHFMSTGMSSGYSLSSPPSANSSAAGQTGEASGGGLPLSTRKIRVSVVQMGIDDGAKESRIARIDELLDRAKDSQLIMLPELWGVGYFSFDKYQEGSEPLLGPTFAAVRSKAVSLSAFIMAGSIVESADSKLHNTSIFIAPNGALIGTYRKVHLFGFGSDERRLLSPGEAVQAFQTELGVFGLSTCFDLRFPELYRKLLDQSVEMYLVASAWPHPRLADWRLFTRARAVENQAFLAAANCAGSNKGRQFCGHSVIVDPYGKVLAEAGEEEEVISADVDLDFVATARRDFPAVNSRVIK